MVLIDSDLNSVANVEHGAKKENVVVMETSHGEEVGEESWFSAFLGGGGGGGGWFEEGMFFGKLLSWRWVFICFGCYAEGDHDDHDEHGDHGDEHDEEEEEHDGDHDDHGDEEHEEHDDEHDEDHDEDAHDDDEGSCHGYQIIMWQFLVNFFHVEVEAAPEIVVGETQESQEEETEAEQEIGNSLP